MEQIVKDGVLVYQLSGDKSHYTVFNCQGCGAERATALTVLDKIDGIPVTEIAAHAFNSCFELREITLPHTISRIGGSAFSCCFKLEKVNIGDLASWLAIDFFAPESNPLYTANGKGGRTLFIDGKPLTSFTLPKGVKVIKQCAFAGYGKLEYADLSEATEIGDYAFTECKSLSEIRFKKLRRIGYRAFDGCDALTGITLPEPCEYIGVYAFKCCHLLTNVTFKASDGWAIVSDGDPNNFEKLDGQTLKNGFEAARYLQYGNKKYLLFYFKKM